MTPPPALPAPLLRAVLAAAGEPAPPAGVAPVPGASNDLRAVRLRDGRTLMVKRSPYAWKAPRFRASRRASALLRREGLVVPEPLPLPQGVDAGPVEAYWRIELPTLREAWSALDAPGRRAALRSWGALLRRVHDVPAPGHGPLHAPVADAATWLRADLGERLLPAAWGEWPEGAVVVERLLGQVDRVGATCREARLVHNDGHMGNVLCRWDGDRVRCVGLLDLEQCGGGPPEADLAAAEVLHRPLFEQALEAGFMEELVAGHGAAPHPGRLAFFRALHLVNLGLWSALVGHAEHAGAVAASAAEEAAGVERLLSRHASGGGGERRSAPAPQTARCSDSDAPSSTSTSTTPSSRGAAAAPRRRPARGASSSGRSTASRSAG